MNILNYTIEFFKFLIDTTFQFESKNIKIKKKNEKIIPKI